MDVKLRVPGKEMRRRADLKNVKILVEYYLLICRPGTPSTTFDTDNSSPYTCAISLYSSVQSHSVHTLPSVHPKRAPPRPWLHTSSFASTDSTCPARQARPFIYLLTSLTYPRLSKAYDSGIIWRSAEAGQLIGGETHDSFRACTPPRAIDELHRAGIYGNASRA